MPSRQPEERTYANVQRIGGHREGCCHHAPQVRSEVRGQRSRVRGERVCLVVVSVLLLVTLTALIVTIVRTCPNTAPSCGEGWDLFGTKCYYFSPNTLKLPWNESKIMCVILKGRLVKIENTEEQNFLDGKVRSLMTHYGDRFWIGLTDSETEGQWKWTDGSPLNISLAFWTRNKLNTEPDDWKVEDPEGEDCVIIGEKKNINGLKSWYDASCKIRRHRSICEKNLPQNN